MSTLVSSHVFPTIVSVCIAVLDMFGARKLPLVETQAQPIHFKKCSVLWFAVGRPVNIERMKEGCEERG